MTNAIAAATDQRGGLDRHCLPLAVLSGQEIVQSIGPLGALHWLAPHPVDTRVARVLGE